MANSGQFKPGHTLSSGRPVGAVSRRRQEFNDALERHNFDPAEALLELYNTAINSHELGNREEKPVYLKIAADLAKEIAGYCYPKLKSVEHTKVTALDGMTIEQKLEAMKQAVLMLEAQVKQDE